ncbi:ABC transporter substrate-binding protein [Planctopirus ephydatiae]|nr:ABC transporter substrate-binding protein [Planctopirus ephydatiae]
MMSSRLVLGWMLCCAMLLAGCPMNPANQAGEGAVKTTDGKTLTPVEITLNWFPEAEHGGFYAALVNGYFEEEGLAVTIKPGGPDIPVVQYVAAGQTQFGVDNADKLLLVRAQEADAVAVLAPLQDSPRCIMVQAESGIKTFDDLAAKPKFTLAMNPGQPFAMYLQKKLDLSKVTVVPYGGSLVPFLTEKDFGTQAYNFSEPFNARKQNANPVNLMVSDLGFNPYTSLLITSRELIEKNPELVQKVVRASLKGWRKYLDDPHGTNTYINSLNKEMGMDILDFGVETLKPLCEPARLPAGQLGKMDPAEWTKLSQQLVEMGALEANQAAPEKAYSTQFFEAATNPEK